MLHMYVRLREHERFLNEVMCILKEKRITRSMDINISMKMFVATEP